MAKKQVFSIVKLDVIRGLQVILDTQKICKHKKKPWTFVSLANNCLIYLNFLLMKFCEKLDEIFRSKLI